jgi:heme/copper-type cytochrome/quinol oxidase subunit 2
LVLALTMVGAAADSGTRQVEIIAASDNTFHVANEKSQVIRAHSGEALRLHVTSQRGREAARDGAVHSLVIRSLREQGWDIRLYEGTHDYEVKAPALPGEYLIECTVKCGRGHDDMRMKLLVEK